MKKCDYHADLGETWPCGSPLPLPSLPVFFTVLLSDGAISQAGGMPRPQPCPLLLREISINLQVKFVFPDIALRYLII